MNSPIKLKPVFKEIVWGGNRLKTDYGFESELNNIAEAWMLCAREDGDNIIENGEYKGTSFKEFISPIIRDKILPVGRLSKNCKSSV